MVLTFKHVVVCAGLFVAACQATGYSQSQKQGSAEQARPLAVRSAELIERDRRAIKAMAGNFNVRFDFLETVSFTEGYEPKDRYLSGGHEVVRVIADEPGYISLQHILVVGGEEKFPVKHWRQDWIYEPEQVLTFIGGNAWEMRKLSAQERAGKWAQVVYQVDDSPRYGAIAAWSHENGVSEWAAPAEMRPLPRRDMTTRDDYHAMLGINRHAITPQGWVHEQDNSKLVLGDNPHVLVREVGVNIYNRFDEFDVDVAENYWAGTADYWAKVRSIWDSMESSLPQFALTLQGETQDLYMPLLDLSMEVQEGQKDVATAVAEAKLAIEKYTTTDLPPLALRLRDAPSGDPYAQTGAR